MTYEILGFLLIAALSVVVGGALANSPKNPFPPKLVLAAVALRIVGSLARYDMMKAFYGGVSDANRYFSLGLQFARRAWNLDLTVFTLGYWFGGPDRWWGTPFMDKLSGLVLSLIGPTIRGEYLVFSMLAFVGLYLIALSAHRVHPGGGAVRYAAWIFLWPSLWFWPSSVGKEAVTVFTIGLVFYGYAGGRGRILWLPYLAGLGIAFALRPHVAAALGLATVAAYWFQSWTRPSPRRIAEAAVAAVLAVALISAMGTQLGLGEVDLEGVEEFIQHRGGYTLRGGSQLESLPSGPTALPMAVVNIWFRPFPWEAHNLMALFSSLELVILWWLAWRNRRWLRIGLKGWWRDRLLSFGFPLLFGYTIMIGLTFGNLGIIARQRTPIFPFVFLLLTAGGIGTVRSQRAGQGIRRRRAPKGYGPRHTRAAGWDGPTPEAPSGLQDHSEVPW